jgi:hypothetical protein
VEACLCACVDASVGSADPHSKQVVASWGKPMVKGETWYVLSRKWLQQFCDYTGFNAERPNEIGAPSPLSPFASSLRRNG